MDARRLLLTDLYQLTMLEAYWREGFTATAVFELFVRKLPSSRNFLLTAGIEAALDYLESARFTADELDYLARTNRFSAEFLRWLATWRFEGDVDALPEGTLFFPDEPMLRVTAPMPQAQLIETRLVNLLQYPTMVASKAARCVLAAPGRTLVEFGARRAHGAESALSAARAAYLAGFSGTSNVLAGQTWEIPVFGTMAHSYVMAHDEEWRAFVEFARAQPDNVVLLIDTYDVMAGVEEVLRAADVLQRESIAVRAVRLDSGDVGAQARQVRRRLDQAGRSEIGIFASGDLDESRLAELVGEDAPIDGYGVGTKLTTCADAPYLSIVYKLQEYDGIPRRKTSRGKQTWPGAKQIDRITDRSGRWQHDRLALADEPRQGMPLLVPVMRSGRRTNEPESLETVRRRAAEQLDMLPEPWRRLEPAPPFPVQVSDAVQRLAHEVDRRHRHADPPGP